MKTISTILPAESILRQRRCANEIEGVNDSTICDYFRKLNHGEFIAAANLFAVAGCLYPPFDNPIQGRNAIAQYLAKEAQGMRFCPEAGEILTSDLNHVRAADEIAPRLPRRAFHQAASLAENRYQIQGTVETKWFAINVCWLFELNAVKEIVLVEIKLLATLPELLNLAGAATAPQL